MTLFYFLIGVAVVLVNFLLCDPIDWWFVIFAVFCSFASYVIHSYFCDD